jgi:hypothetical protein
MNALGKEYRQFGGDYQVQHHTEFLAALVADGRLAAAASATSTIAFHDPCYLGRHNQVYDAPRNLLNVISNSVVELERNRENSFCCGAGGAQFWKEEEPGEQRISDNRYLEAQHILAGAGDKVLAVGCPFCKSMLESTPAKGADGPVVRDVAELLLEAVQRKNGVVVTAPLATTLAVKSQPIEVAQPVSAIPAPSPSEPLVDAPVVAPLRQKWVPKTTPAAESQPTLQIPPAPPPEATPLARKQWKPKSAPRGTPANTGDAANTEVETAAPRFAASVEDETPAAQIREEAPVRKKWSPKSDPKP